MITQFTGIHDLKTINERVSNYILISNVRVQQNIKMLFILILYYCSASIPIIYLFTLFHNLSLQTQMYFYQHALLIFFIIFIFLHFECRTINEARSKHLNLNEVSLLPLFAFNIHSSEGNSFISNPFPSAIGNKLIK